MSIYICIYIYTYLYMNIYTYMHINIYVFQISQSEDQKSPLLAPL
jgi:hypothetical protein